MCVCARLRGGVTATRVQADCVDVRARIRRYNSCNDYNVARALRILGDCGIGIIGESKSVDCTRPKCRALL